MSWFDVFFGLAIFEALKERREEREIERRQRREQAVWTDLEREVLDILDRDFQAMLRRTDALAAAGDANAYRTAWDAWAHRVIAPLESLTTRWRLLEPPSAIIERGQLPRLRAMQDQQVKALQRVRDGAVMLLEQGPEAAFPTIQEGMDLWSGAFEMGYQMLTFAERLAWEERYAKWAAKR